MYGELRLRPLQYNAASRTLRRYSRIVVRVEFEDEGLPLRASRAGLSPAAINEEAQTPAPRRASGVRRNSVLASGPWYRFAIRDDGMYRLSGQALLDAGVPPSTDPATIKIYSNGGTDLPMDVTAPYVDDLRENAVMASDAGVPGQLDAADGVVFFGKGTRGWNYNPGTKTTSHYISRFSETNVYWLTHGGAPARQIIFTASLADPAPYRPATVTGRIFREDDKVNILSSGIEWLGQPFNAGDQITYVHPLNDIDATQPVSYLFRLGARSSGFSNFSVYEHDALMLTVGVSTTDPTSYFASQFVNSVRSMQLVPAFTDGRSQLRFAFSTSSSAGIGYLDWYELSYRQFLRAHNELFTFRTEDTTAVAEYAVTGFAGGPVSVFDVSRYDSVVRITNPVLSGDTCRFQAPLLAGGVREFYVVGDAGYKSPSSIVRTYNQNLHGDTAEAAEIIIVHPEFYTAAQRLKAHRERPGSGYLKTLLVDVTQIYNEFGGGIVSPAGIRNYLRYVDSTWSAPPQYVLLFGDGDYDFKRVTATAPNWIPPWETAESWVPISTYAGEDEFVTFTVINQGGTLHRGRVEMALGRLSARSLAEANTMVDKLIEYETTPVKDPWRMRVTLVGDDGPAGIGPDGRLINDGLLHTLQADSISKYVPALFEKRKIYSYEYTTAYTPAGRRKPDVNVAIKNQINQGTLVLNFTGHGNPRVWTDEQIFVRETDFPGLANKGKYFFLCAATCNYSHVDMVSEQSGGEVLMTMPNAGAIGVLSATRPVFAGDNYELNKTFYRNFFSLDAGGNVLPKRIGDALYLTKLVHSEGLFDNDRKFFLLADPGLRVGFPEDLSTVDSINGQPVTVTAQLRALSRTTVDATVRDSTGAAAAFGGTAQLVVYDAERTVLLAPPDLTRTMTYKIAGNVLFRGEQPVTGGRLRSTFVVPKDISYGNDLGRMTLYAWNGQGDAAGYTTNFRVGGTDSTAPPDVEGPRVSLYIDDTTRFRSGDVVSASPRLFAVLFDSNGINTSGAGVGHRIEAWLDEAPQSIDLGDYYRSRNGSYQEGVAEYPLGPLSTGTHTIRVRAWDTYNNSSSGETVFDVVTGVGLRLAKIFNFPNPFASETIFTFEHNQLSPIDVQVKIYTVAGRAIQTLQRSAVSDPLVQIPWDGRDRDGDPVANGVYLYKIIAKTQDGRFASEALEKLTVLK
jgi:hypothetical protein